MDPLGSVGGKQIFGVIPPKTSFELQLFLHLLRSESQSCSKSQFFYGSCGNKVMMEMQSIPFQNYLRVKLHVLKLYLYAGVALKKSSPANGTWNPMDVLLLLFITLHLIA